MSSWTYATKILSILSDKQFPALSNPKRLSNAVAFPHQQEVQDAVCNRPTQQQPGIPVYLTAPPGDKESAGNRDRIELHYFQIETMCLSHLPLFLCVFQIA